MTEIHVYPKDGLWHVRCKGCRRSTLFDTKAAAQELGKTLALRHKAERVVFRIDGSVQSRDTFAPEPFPKGDK